MRAPQPDSDAGHGEPSAREDGRGGVRRERGLWGGGVLTFHAPVRFASSSAFALASSAVSAAVSVVSSISGIVTAGPLLEAQPRRSFVFLSSIRARAHLALPSSFY